jgi:catechol 2,3-dioxygenase
VTADLTRRTLLRLAGAASMMIAAARAAEAEGMMPGSPGPTFANRTPVRIGKVALKVRDLETMAAFYRDVLGMSVISRTSDEAVLGAGGVPLLVLESAPDAPLAPPNSAGLFHTAFLMPERRDLARWLVYVAQNRVPLTGFADHLVSEAVYLDDPEGNGIEVYADRAPETWHWTGSHVDMATDPIDFDSLLALTDPQRSDFSAAPDGLRVGHIHLRVGDIPKADAFYKTALGLDQTAALPSASFLSSGRYHHHVGMNTWQSAGAGPRDASKTGLSWFAFEAADKGLIEAPAERLKAAGASVATIDGGVETVDPWGTKVRILAA